MEIDVTETEELVARAKKAYDAVREWPERRGGAGFMDLLALRNIVPELIDAIERLSSGGGWRSIESAPKDGTVFIAFQHDDIYLCRWLAIGEEGRFDEGWWDINNTSLEEPTHWQPYVPPGASSGEVANADKMTEIMSRLQENGLIDHHAFRGLPSAASSGEPASPAVEATETEVAQARSLARMIVECPVMARGGIPASRIEGMARALLAAPPSPVRQFKPRPCERCGSTINETCERPASCIRRGVEGSAESLNCGYDLFERNGGAPPAPPSPDQIAAARREEMERMREALTELLRVRDWVISAGGTEGPLPQDVIEQFAKMSGAAYDQARAALSGTGSGGA